MSKGKNQTISQATEMTEGQEIKREFASGFALEGEFVKNMKDKVFTILKYRIIAGQDLDNPGQLKEKLILTVQLGDGTEVDYYPNKTSQKVIISERGYAYKDWVNFKGKFTTKSQRVGANDKEVIYIETI